jgi:hypothetical protein
VAKQKISDIPEARAVSKKTYIYAPLNPDGSLNAKITSSSLSTDVNIVGIDGQPFPKYGNSSDQPLLAFYTKETSALKKGRVF